jgi:hypothetical protein
VEVLRWMSIRDNMILPPVYLSLYMEAAAGAGQIAVMEFMFTQLGALLNTTVMRRAVENNRVDAIRWLELRGCPRLA